MNKHCFVILICLFLFWGIQIEGHTKQVNTEASINGAATNIDDLTPPNSVFSMLEVKDYITISISLIALLCSGCALYFSKKRTRLMIDKNQFDLNNTFWTGPLLIPLCIEPLKDFIVNNEMKLKNLTQNSNGLDTHKEYIKKFRKEINDISIRMTLISSLDKIAYEKIKKASENLDDKVTSYCAYHSTSNELKSKSNKLDYDDIIVSLYGFLHTTVQSIAGMQFKK